MARACILFASSGQIAMPPRSKPGHKRKAAELPHPGAAEPGRLTVSGAAEPRLQRAMASFKRPASVPETHAASSNSRHDETAVHSSHNPSHAEALDPKAKRPLVSQVTATDPATKSPSEDKLQPPTFEDLLKDALEHASTAHAQLIQDLLAYGRYPKSLNSSTTTAVYEMICYDRL